MNLTQVNERLDQIESEVLRFKNGRVNQLLDELKETRLRIAAFIGAAASPDAARAALVTLAVLEKAAILHALSVCRNPKAAAEVLGIGKTTLYRKLTEYAKETA
jgi:transcriptional regulator of acetoin/glycerol metabolism